MGRSESTDGRDERSPYQRDLDRIIYSPAFRRLQDKTQVHALNRHDHVRTRLTHSIEVASAGRSLGNIAGEHLQKQHPEITPDALSAIVQAACLTHDIGNPPFGHLGESAIRHFFAGKGAAYMSGLSEEEAADLLNFDGNAQGFRILSRLEMYKNAGGMQLTAATLGAFTKYPRPALTPDGAVSKFGFFQSEAALFAEVAEKTGLSSGDGKDCLRHPLSFLTEAADDICYTVNDLEDGVEMGLLSPQEACKVLAPLADKSTNTEDVSYLRAKAIGRLINQAAKTFQTWEDDILAGTFSSALLKEAPEAEAVKNAKAFAVERVFRHQNVVMAEMPGFEVLGGLLETFCPLLPALEQNGDALPPHADRLRCLLNADFSACSTRYERILTILDAISGWTDRYAVSMYRRLKGIEL